MIQIAMLNESTAISDAEVRAMLPAFGQQWNLDLQPIWGVGDANFTFISKDQSPATGTWWVVFLDDSDQADALAYHDLTNEGLPISKVFVKTILADKSSLSVGATHEICEMAVDPWLNSAYQDPHGTFWAGEVCDPVEDDQYGYEIAGVLVTEFVTPNWFAHERAQGDIDSKVTRTRLSRSSPEDTRKNSKHGRDGNRSPAPRQGTASELMPPKVHAGNGVLVAPGGQWSAVMREWHRTGNELPSLRALGSRIHEVVRKVGSSVFSDA